MKNKKETADSAKGGDVVRTKREVRQEDGLKARTVWNIGRWESRNDFEARKIYTPQEAIRLFGAPQFTTVEKNILLNIGINEIWTLVCSGGGVRYDAANAQLGVGDATTAEAATHTSLQAVRSRSPWAASTAYALGAFVRPATVDDTNIFVYEVTTAGTSAATEPVWPTTDGATVTNGTAVFTARRRIWFNAQIAGFPTFGTVQRAEWRSRYEGAEANYAWNEFGVRNGPTRNLLLNRRVSAQGTKVSGHIWELSLTITLS